MIQVNVSMDNIFWNGSILTHGGSFLVILVCVFDTIVGHLYVVMIIFVSLAIACS